MRSWLILRAPLLLLLLGASNLRAEPGPVAPAPPSPGEARDPAPEFELPDLDGRIVGSRYVSRPATMVHFWATWCVPCIRDIPELNRLAAAYEPAGARILAVALDTATPGELRQIAKLYGIRHTVLIGTGEVAQGFGGVGSFPTTFIVNSQGMIVEKSVGVAPELIRRSEARLRSLIKASGGELPPQKPGGP